MKLYAAIMLGGALGSAARFAMASFIDQRVNSMFPWGTVAVNILGCFIIGLFFGLVGPFGRSQMSPAIWAFVVFGLIGGFTTFSSFSLQTVVLLQEGRWFLAAGNILASVILCLLATVAGAGLAGLAGARS